jgi:hypothetical protein
MLMMHVSVEIPSTLRNQYKSLDFMRDDEIGDILLSLRCSNTFIGASNPI